MPDYIYRGSIGPEEEKIYGKNNWYDWSNENWGTKWNSCDTTFKEDTFSFWTAWSPCSPVIEKLAEMFPDASFDYWYEESGMCFCGQEKYEGGKLVYIMNADMHERYIDDVDDDENIFHPIDLEYGREIEIIINEENDEKCRSGKLVRIKDEEECRTLIEGFFCEGTGDYLRDKLYGNY